MKPDKDRHKPRKLVPVSLELYERIAEVAKAADRPVTWQIRRVLEEYLEREAKKGK